MPYVLPKAASKAKKFKVLSGDTRKIAEELIRKKFGIEEEVVADDDHISFRREQSIGFDTVFAEPQYNAFMDRQRGYYDGIFIEVNPWSRSKIAKLRIREASEHSLVTALRRMDAENMRHDRRFIMSPDFFNRLIDTEWSDRFFYGCERREDNSIGKIFGVKVVVTPTVMDCVLESVY